MSATQSFKGGPELERFLSTLPVRLQKNVLRSGMRAGANVAKKAAQETLGSQANETGQLRKGLKVSTRVVKTEVIARLRATGEHAYIAHWIEFGVQPHSVARGADISRGKKQHIGPFHPGFPGIGFMRRSLDENVAQIVGAVGEQISLRLSKIGLDAPVLTVDDE
ncbi:MAG: HK97 gp10 family phage protein [Alphaproteobacteria bacterium]|nr:HK97 gp10 family phage protein [Alphaproteobacteria bacterium]